MKQVIIDLDDTLIIGTFALYGRAIDAWVAYMEELGLQGSRAAFQEHDWELIRQHGVGDKHRFPRSMVQVALRLLAEAGMTPPEGMGAHLHDLGYGIYATHVPTHPRAFEALGYLADNGYDLDLLTQGDPDIQLRRLHDSGLGHFFATVTAVPRKTVETLRGVVRTPDAWVVGDSLTSDIAPAIALGLRCAHVRPRQGLTATRLADFAAHADMEGITLVVDDIYEAARGLVLYERRKAA